MKSYKRIILVLIVLIFTFIVCICLKNNRDIFYKSVSSNTKDYLISYENDFTTTYDSDGQVECSRYYEGMGTKAFGYDEVDEGYPMYIINGCAVTLENYLNNTDDDSNACNIQKFYTQKYLSSNTIVDEYNNYCKNTTGELEVSYNGLSCSDAKEKIVNYFIDYKGLYEWYIGEGNCSAKTGNINLSDINKNGYNLSHGNCERKRIFNKDATSFDNIGYTGILRRSLYNLKNNGYENDCDYGLYYVNGYSTTFEDYKTKVGSSVLDAYCNILYNEVKSYADNNDITNFYASNYDYKLICVDTGVKNDEIIPPDGEVEEKKEYIDIVFRADNAYGLKCEEKTYENYVVFPSGNNECTYRFNKELAGQTFTINNMPDTTNLQQLTTGYKFSGWKRGSETNCNSGNITITLPNNINEISYFACFDGEEKKSLGYTLYKNCDGNYKTDNVVGKLDVNNTAILNSNVVSTQEYINENAISKSVGHGNSFMLNQFCKITCTEIFNYSYPTIFETVKSGTYFELLSYPEIRSQLTCTEIFNYSDWEIEYKNKIDAEKEAYVDKLNFETIDDLDFGNGRESISCGCKRYDDGRCNTYYDEYTATDDYYVYNNGFINKETTTVSYCENEDVDDAKEKLKRKYNLDSKTNYTQKYDSAVGERKAVEAANNTCANTMTKEQVSTDSFYNVKNSDVYFYYESDVDDNNNELTGDENKYYKEELKTSNTYINDTDVHDKNSNTFSKEEIPFTIDYNDAPTPKNVELSFKAIKTNENLERTVIRNYIYAHSDNHNEYYSDYQTGKITTSNSKNNIYLGYVYPVKLTLSGTRNVYFSIIAKTNLNYGANTLLNSVPSSIDDSNVYKCNYDISNDIIVEDKTTEKEDYKKNFYIRSISTQDVDPNDRFNSGTLGANWANEKGQALISIIEKKAEGNNTYNPNNLEYSFTLNAGTIEAIRDYNKTVGRYDNFDETTFSCNDVGGECESKFLNEISGNNNSGNNRVNAKLVKGVNAVMKRESWKYYIDGKWMKTKSLTGSSNWENILNSTKSSADDILKTCRNDSSAKSTYDCVYRTINEGVLP